MMICLDLLMKMPFSSCLISPSFCSMSLPMALTWLELASFLGFRVTVSSLDLYTLPAMSSFPWASLVFWRVRKTLEVILYLALVLDSRVVFTTWVASQTDSSSV